MKKRTWLSLLMFTLFSVFSVSTSYAVHSKSIPNKGTIETTVMPEFIVPNEVVIESNANYYLIQGFNYFDVIVPDSYVKATAAACKDPPLSIRCRSEELNRKNNI